MELSLRLDTLGMVEVRYLCGVAFFPIPPFLPALPTSFLWMSPHEECIADSHSDKSHRSRNMERGMDFLNQVNVLEEGDSVNGAEEAREMAGERFQTSTRSSLGKSSSR